MTDRSSRSTMSRGAPQRSGNSPDRKGARKMVQPEGPKERRSLSAGAIATATGGAVLLIFILQNTSRVRFRFLFVSFIWPMWLYTIVVAVVGAVVWLGLGIVRRHRRRQGRREARAGQG